MINFLRFLPYYPTAATLAMPASRRRTAVSLAALLCLAASFAPAQNLPSGFAEFQVMPFPPSSVPENISFAPDGRIFVCYKYGQLRVIKNGALLPAPFVTLSVSGANERGLLGVAFDPTFASNGYVYVYYTVTTNPIHNRISRFTADPNNPDVALANSEFVLMDLDPVTTSYHNSGDIHFGNDGKLYVNSGNDTVGSNSQSLNNRLGKVLRINSDGSIPADNPFVNNPSVSPPNTAIWVYGLRNPWHAAVQPTTGRIFVMDVGESSWEEINDGVAGANFGWPLYEGYTNAPGYTSPILAYAHGDGDNAGRAITGGAFYNPPFNAASPFPASYTSQFFYGDYVNGWIRMFDPTAHTDGLFADNLAPSLVDMEVGPDGSLYYLTIAGTPPLTPALYKIQYTGIRSPQIGTQPTSHGAATGTTTTFLLRVSGDQPMTFQWRRNGVNIPGANSASYTTPVLSSADDQSTYDCVVTNSFGTQTSVLATLTVTPNTPPVATITAPAAGLTYNAGDTILFSGTGTDQEDGNLPYTAYTWQVDFQHDTHVHPGFLPATSGIKSGPFTTATTGEVSANTWYRIYLTVTDSAGISTTTYREVFPNKSTVTLDTQPSGLQVTRDGTPFTAPLSTVGVVNFQRPIGVGSPQVVNGITYQFVSWSDGGAANHVIQWPASDTTLVAQFVDSSTVTNGAQFVSQTIPSPMNAGSTYLMTVVMKNTGTSTWPAGAEYKLGAVNPYDNTTWGFNRVALNKSVAPGDNATLNFYATAPSTPGVYTAQWQMLQEGRQWFGDWTPQATVVVNPPPNNATFVSQSVPTSMIGGQSYPVSITMQNTGTSTWPANSTFGLGSRNPRDNQTWGGSRVPLTSSVPPGRSVTFNFTLVAPSTTPGIFNFQWQMVDDASGWFGSMTDNLSIDVSTAADASTFITQSVPANMAAGHGSDIRIILKNTGTNTWPLGLNYRLGSQSPQDNTTWGANRVNLPNSVAPGYSVMIPFNVVAPTNPGDYNFQWRLVNDGAGWFGDFTPNIVVHVGIGPTITSQPSDATVIAGQTATFNVTASGSGVLSYQWQKNSTNIAGATSPTYTTPPVATSDNNTTFRCVVKNIYGSQTSNSAKLTVTSPNASAFVSQSVPANMVAGQIYPVTVTMKNTGSSTWTFASAYKLGSQNPRDNTTWGFNRVLLNSSNSVAPGSNYTFSFNVTAPTTPGTYHSQWQMLQETSGGGWFGPLTPDVAVSISAPTPTPTPTPVPANNAAFVSQTVPGTMSAGQTYNVSVTVQNTGTATWTFPQAYKLGSSNPRDNTTWGFNRVRLAPNTSVAPGGNYTFNFSVAAPTTTGPYNFQWQMIQEKVQWFSATTPNVAVTVQ